VARARRRWVREQGLLDPARLVFIDETAVTTNMVRLNGWNARGKRLVGDVPMGHLETVTFIAGFRQTGIVAPMLIKGAIQARGGPTALALAAVITQHSPLVRAFDRRIIARLFGDRTNFGFTPNTKISVTADSVVCRTSNVDITARTCDLTFGNRKRTTGGAPESCPL
jgi:hypothetical protein